MPACILVVDDEPDMHLLIRRRFRQMIRDQECELCFALNGVEALHQLGANPQVEVMLTDIKMPEMDGLALLNETAAKYPLLKSIVVSAYHDMPNIRTALNRGAFDFLTKPIDFQDLKITVDKALHAAAASKEAERDHEHLVVIRRELDIARKIQASLLPSLSPFSRRSDFQLVAEMLPAKQVGGDFYDCFFIDKSNVGFVVGDVSGKGVPAALFMALSRTLLKITALEGMPPHECLAEVNRLLVKESTAGMFVTVFYGKLNMETGVVQYSNGGHNLPYVLRGNGKIESSPPTAGTILGGIGEIAFDSGQFTLEPGESVFLFTDGVTEARDPNKDFYGNRRLEVDLEASAAGPLAELTSAVLESVRKFSANTPQADDITVLALRYLAGKSAEVES